MSEETPFRVDREEFLNDIMMMRSTTEMVISFKKAHPKIFPGDNALWAKDIEQLAEVIQNYDSLIVKLLEINMQQSDLMDKMTERMNAVLKGSA